MLELAIIAGVALTWYFIDQGAQGNDVLDEVFGVKLTPAQIANVAELGGFQGEDLQTAVAVALAESSGNPKAYNPETKAGAPQGKGSYGLWQIYLHAHPEFEGVDLTDPVTNAQAAYQVYSSAGSSFTPWSTFTSGVYQMHLDQAIQAVNA